tara:strand:- start:112 stop:732 length:621 start_codon:yes stop_codon:yes gene_type:complete
LDNLVDEIKEDLKKEQLLKIWKEYGNYIIGVIIALVFSGIGYVYWDYSQEKLRLELAQAYESAVRETDPKIQKNAFDKLAGSALKGYSVIGVFEAAEISSDPVAAYRQIARDTRHDQVFRDFALLKAILKELPTGDPHSLLDEISALTKKATPWRESAFEIEATLYLMAGKVEQALDLFETLAKSKSAPRGVQQRSRIMLDLANNR